MLNLSGITLKAYTEENLPKNLTISFPYADIPNITNDHILEESMILKQSICEDSILKPGGCNASQFEIMVYDIQNELKDKDIIVTMDVKDKNFKGPHVIGSDYNVDDVVKYNGDYYRYFKETSGEYTEEMISNTYDTTIKSYGTEGNIYNIEFDWLINTEIDQYLTVKYSEADRPDNTNIYLTIWWDGYNYGTRYTLANNTSFKIPKSTTVNGVTYPPLGIWLRADNSAGVNMEEFARKVIVSVQQKERISHCYPDKIPEYCDREYGYYDTSETQDIILFRGKIESAQKQQDTGYSKIVAYDKLYDLSGKSVKNWFNNSKFAKNYDEAEMQFWTLYVTYTKGDLVKDFEQLGNSGLYQTRCFRCKNTLDKNRLTTLSPIDAIKMTEIYECHFPGSYYWEEIPSSEWIHPTIKELRDELFAWLGIEQEEVTLPMDSVHLWCKSMDEEVDARKLLQAICEINLCFGIFDSNKGKFRYLQLDGLKTDPCFKGIYKNEMRYSPGDIVVINNEETQGEDVYYQCISSENEGHLPTANDSEGKYWGKRLITYHPSGAVNLSRLYEYGGVEYGDKAFVNTGLKIVDENGTALKGLDKDTEIPITYNFLWKGWNKLNELWSSIDILNQYNGQLKYEPAKIKCLGIPLLQCGDNVCFDVIEEYEDDEGNIISSKKTIQTIVFSRTLSGIHALSDEIEAKRE